VKIDSFVAGSPAGILVPHHILCFQHFLHELLLLVHDLEVCGVDIGQLLLHDFRGHTHGGLSGLEDVVVAPQPVHREDLRIRLLGRRLHVRVQAHHRRLLRYCRI